MNSLKNEIDHVFGEISANTNYQPNPDEIHAIRWATLHALEAEYAQNPLNFSLGLKKPQIFLSRFN